MKIKKLLIPLLLIIICMLAFSACLNGTEFNFDENSIVKLAYTCMDEEQNFDAELTTEQSRNFILFLNKITYSEVKEHIDFGPSHDHLRITIGNDNIDLYDVWTMINNGGYLYFNGKFCKTKEKFDFLNSYLKEYAPDNISDSRL
ncbi:MAG: hypothetical protein K2L12_03010 [Clostridia bacterium]|nr:hypothetical protein [Clostridia bacterium]